jgi:hypothetical protein
VPTTGKRSTARKKQIPRPPKCGGLGMTEKSKALRGILGLLDTLVDIGVFAEKEVIR